MLRNSRGGGKGAMLTLGKGDKLALFDSNTFVVMLEPHCRHNDIPLLPY